MPDRCYALLYKALSTVFLRKEKEKLYLQREAVSPKRSCISKEKLYLQREAVSPVFAAADDKSLHMLSAHALCKSLHMLSATSLAGRRKTERVSLSTVETLERVSLSSVLVRKVPCL